MSRLLVAFMLMLGVLTTLAVPAVAQPTAAIDQAGWAARKQNVALPNGVRLAYVELGNPSGKPLLLLHGFTDTSRSWSLLVPYLGDYRLLIPDQRGHGASAAPDCCYSTSVMADDARLFLDALKIQRAAVAGHSMGSMVAIAMAADHPGRVTELILIGSTALAPVKRGDWLYEEVSKLKAPLDPGSGFMRDWHPANQPTPVDPEFAKYAMDEILAIPLPVWRGVMRELAAVPVGRHASDVVAPVLILSGGKDPLFPAEHHAALLKAFPTAQAKVYADLGHNPLWEKPSDIAAAMSAFLARPTAGLSQL